MFMGKYARRAVALAGVLAVALIGVAAVGLWAGAVGPASTDAALVDPAAAMDHDAGVCFGDLLEDSGSATPPDVGLNAHPCHGCTKPPCSHPVCVTGFPACCWVCPGGEPFCQG
ncbi:MAG: hypothetical protein IH987_10190 [Planctomycetes bacterium]|nr:hypothetical protein [Planctomycetota bacterium]